MFVCTPFIHTFIHLFVCVYTYTEIYVYMHTDTYRIFRMQQER